ncbi:hypothetical protein AGMMS49574_28410 [Bacteroidia bacterium]|nr:hypothetical protein AGMMS49574_28410 [Bacteroidia bacterium]
MEKNKNEAINFFKEKIIDFFVPIKILHIGSNQKLKNDDCNYESDFDIIIIVEDEIDCYEYSKQISSILKETIVKFDILISAYPIKESIYLNGISEFLNNVRINSTEIWKI